MPLSLRLSTRVLAVATALAMVLAGPARGAAEAEAEAAEGDPAAAAAAQEAGTPVYVTLKDISLPVFEDRRVAQVLSLELAIEVSGSRTAGEASRLEPRLRDAVYTSLYDQVEEGRIVRASGSVDLKRLRRTVYTASTKVLGDDQVRDVLVQRLSQLQVH